MWLWKEIQEVLRTSLSTVTAAFTGCLPNTEPMGAYSPADSVKFAAVHESLDGTFRTSSDVRSSVAIGGKAEVRLRGPSGQLNIRTAARPMTAALIQLRIAIRAILLQFLGKYPHHRIQMSQYDQ